MKTAKQDWEEIKKWEAKIEESRKILDTPNLEKIDYMAARAKIDLACNFIDKKRVKMAAKIGQK